jgi:hypothetical protein
MQVIRMVFVSSIGTSRDATAMLLALKHHQNKAKIVLFHTFSLVDI